MTTAKETQEAQAARLQSARDKRQLSADRHKTKESDLERRLREALEKGERIEREKAAAEEKAKRVEREKAAAEEKAQANAREKDAAERKARELQAQLEA